MSRSLRMPVQVDPLRIDTIGPDTPLRLDVAAMLAYPDGSMTGSGLRREHKRGRLTIERVAGKDFTTLAAIERMRELCRVNREVPASISRPNAETPPAALPTPPSGKSAMVDTTRARAALRQTLQEQKQLLSDTSTASIRPQRGSRNVIPLR